MKKYNVKRAKEYLQQARTAREKVIQCSYVLDELRFEYAKLTANYSEGIAGGIKHDTSDYIANLLEQERKVEEQKRRYQLKQYEIANFILNLDVQPEEEKLKKLLILRYVNFKEFDDIFMLMGYSYNYLVQVMHPKALFIVEKELDKQQK